MSDLGLNHEALAAAWAMREHTRVCSPHTDFDHPPPQQVTSGVSQESSLLPLSGICDVGFLSSGSCDRLPHSLVSQEWRSPSPIWSGTSPTVLLPQLWGGPAPDLELVRFWKKTAVWKHHPPTSQSLSRMNGQITGRPSPTPSPNPGLFTRLKTTLVAFSLIITAILKKFF